MNTENDQLILINGASGTGKSASLMNIRNQDKWFYLNTEAGKRLPFRNNFRSFRIEDPLQVLEAFDHAIEHRDEVEGIIIDSLTFLMEMYESTKVLTAENTMKAWSNYNQYFKSIMQDRVIKFNKPTIIIAHTQDVYDEKNMEYKTAVPIKGSLKGTGVEAYFSTIVATKKVSIKDLENYSSDLLHITEEEKELGYKHCFQTRITKGTTGERIRSPIGMFTKEQTFIDNDAQLLLDYLTKFYSN